MCVCACLLGLSYKNTLFGGGETFSWGANSDENILHKDKNHTLG